MGVTRFEDLIAWQPAFLKIAAGSLHETKNHLQDGLKQQYLSAERHEHMKRLCLRAMKANVRLIAYLRHAKPPEPFEP
jgi:four helix bundle protein